MTADEFRAALKELRMSQLAWATRFGLSPGAVNRWAKGTRPVPPWVAEVIRMLQERRELSRRLAG